MTWYDINYCVHKRQFPITGLGKWFWAVIQHPNKAMDILYSIRGDNSMCSHKLICKTAVGLYFFCIVIAWSHKAIDMLCSIIGGNSGISMKSQKYENCMILSTWLNVYESGKIKCIMSGVFLNSWGCNFESKLYRNWSTALIEYYGIFMP